MKEWKGFRSQLTKLTEQEEYIDIPLDEMAIGSVAGVSDTKHGYPPSHGDINKIPPLIVMKRRAIRVFPDGQKVALYWADKIGKYISVPFSAIGIQEAWTHPRGNNVPVPPHRPHVGVHAKSLSQLLKVSPEDFHEPTKFTSSAEHYAAAAKAYLQLGTPEGAAAALGAGASALVRFTGRKIGQGISSAFKKAAPAAKAPSPVTSPPTPIPPTPTPAAPTAAPSAPVNATPTPAPAPAAPKPVKAPPVGTVRIGKTAVNLSSFPPHVQAAIASGQSNVSTQKPAATPAPATPLSTSVSDTFKQRVSDYKDAAKAEISARMEPVIQQHQDNIDKRKAELSQVIARMGKNQTKTSPDFKKGNAPWNKGKAVGDSWKFQSKSRMVSPDMQSKRKRLVRVKPPSEVTEKELRAHLTSNNVPPHEIETAVQNHLSFINKGIKENAIPGTIRKIPFGGGGGAIAGAITSLGVGGGIGAAAIGAWNRFKKDPATPAPAAPNATPAPPVAPVAPVTPTTTPNATPVAPRTRRFTRRPAANTNATAKKVAPKAEPKTAPAPEEPPTKTDNKKGVGLTGLAALGVGAALVGGAALGGGGGVGAHTNATPAFHNKPVEPNVVNPFNSNADRIWRRQLQASNVKIPADPYRAPTMYEELSVKFNTEINGQVIDRMIGLYEALNTKNKKMFKETVSKDAEGFSKIINFSLR